MSTVRRPTRAKKKVVKKMTETLALDDAKGLINSPAMLELQKAFASNASALKWGYITRGSDGKPSLSGLHSWACYGIYTDHAPKGYVGTVLDISIKQRITKWCNSAQKPQMIKPLLAKAAEFYKALFDVERSPWRVLAAASLPVYDAEGHLDRVIIRNTDVSSPLFVNWMIALRTPFYSAHSPPAVFNSWCVFTNAGVDPYVAMALTAIARVMPTTQVSNSHKDLLAPYEDDERALQRFQSGGDYFINSTWPQHNNDYGYFDVVRFLKGEPNPDRLGGISMNKAVGIPNNKIWGSNEHILIKNPRVLSTVEEDQPKEIVKQVFGNTTRSKQSTSPFGLLKPLVRRIEDMMNGVKKPLEFNMEGVAL